MISLPSYLPRTAALDLSYSSARVRAETDKGSRDDAAWQAVSIAKLSNTNANRRGRRGSRRVTQRMVFSAASAKSSASFAVNRGPIAPLIDFFTVDLVLESRPIPGPNWATLLMRNRKVLRNR